MKKIILLFISLFLSLSSYSAPGYLLYPNAMELFTQYFDDYFENPNYTDTWTSFTPNLPYTFTDWEGYNAVKTALELEYIEDMFNDLNTAKVNGTITSEMTDDFYTAIYNEVILGGVVEIPDITDISLAGTYCSETDLTINTPTVSSGSAITDEGWEIETAVGSVTYTSLSLPYTLSSADNNKRIRYFASNDAGTTYSNVIALSVTTTPTITTYSNDTLCGSGIATLSATTDSGTIYWYNNSTGGCNIYTSSSFLPTVDTTTTYYVEATANGCTTPIRQEIVAVVSPDTTYWLGTTDSDWQNANNWDAGTPGECSTVYITEAPNNPDISSIGTAYCKNIIFKPEASIYGIENLSYEKASVQIGLKRNKWYMLTSPLKESYSGDYYFTGSPIAYMKLFGTTSANSNTFTSSTQVSADWTQSFANLTESLNPGEGFAFLIDSSEWKYPNGISYNNNDTIITFPRTNGSGDLITEITPYSGITGKPYPSIAKHIEKDANKAFRFAMEDDNNNISDITIELEAGLNLIGNPSMSQLDFTKLYADNDSLILPFAKYWDGESFSSITTTGVKSGIDIDGLSLIIPPMKSFVVYASSSGTLTIKSSHFILNGDVKLRSSSTTEVIYIEADNGEYNSSSAIAFTNNNTNAIDYSVEKLFSPTNNSTEIYTLKNNISLDINYINKSSAIIPIGLKGNKKDSLTLRFRNLENLTDIDIKLINTQTGETTSFDSSTEVQIQYDETYTDGTLFLELRNATIDTNISDTELYEDTYISSNNQVVKVISPSNNKILSIELFSITGKKVFSEKDIPNNHYKFKFDGGENIFLIKVQTEKGIITKKIKI